MAATVRDVFLPPLGFLRNAINTFLVNDGRRPTRTDAGAGALIPTGGGLTANLAPHGPPRPSHFGRHPVYSSLRVGSLGGPEPHFLPRPAFPG